MFSTARKACLAMLFATVLLVSPRALVAQGGPLFQVSYAKQLKAVGVGAGWGLALGEMTTQTGIWGQASVDLFFPDDIKVLNGADSVVTKQSYYEFNMNFIKVAKVVPGLFVGAGINYSTLRFDIDDYRGELDGANLGVSVLGGFHFGPWKQAPFVQARYEFGGGKQFVVSAGVAF